MELEHLQIVAGEKLVYPGIEPKGAAAWRQFPMADFTRIGQNPTWQTGGGRQIASNCWETAAAGLGMAVAFKASSVRNSAVCPQPTCSFIIPAPAGGSTHPAGASLLFCGVFRWPGYYLHQHRNEAWPKPRKKLPMKTKILLTLAVAALAAAAFTASANDAVHSPRANDNQIVKVQGAETVAVLAATGVAQSPRAQASQAKTVAGATAETNPYLDCRSSMTAGKSPKAIGACIGSPGMTGCVTVAMQK